MPAMTTDTLAKLRPGIHEAHRLYMLEQDRCYEDVTGSVISSENNFEEIVALGDLGVARSTREAGGIPYGTAQTPFSKKYYVEQFSAGMHLSVQVAIKGLYKQYIMPTQLINKAMYEALEASAAAVINNCTNSSYTGMDAVVLSSTAHPTSTGTFSNKSTAAAFSAGALQTLITDVASQKTYADQPYRQGGQWKLLVPPALDFAAQIVLGSTKQAGTADNDANMVTKRVMLTKANPNFTSTTRYAIVSAKNNPIFRVDGIPMTFRDDIDSGDATYKYYAIREWVYGWKSGNGIQLNEGA